MNYRKAYALAVLTAALIIAGITTAASQAHHASTYGGANELSR